ncbi:hypothetical protein ACFVZD_00265 [Streptomyces sp. NPDC058287]|uniref:hypothetical protein n=1 Tax=unclassified Streptomyces TaxID=2593676 RepID=UPI0036E2467B
MKAHAEIEQVWPRDGRIRVVGRLHGTRAQAGGRVWRLLLVRRGRADHQLRYAARLDGDRFECELPVEDLAAYEAAGTDRWDLHLTDGSVRLRAGRRLDDIRGKKTVMVYPWQPVRGTFGVRPYFTVEDNLSLECRV